MAQNELLLIFGVKTKKHVCVSAEDAWNEFEKESENQNHGRRVKYFPSFNLMVLKIRGLKFNFQVILD